MSLGRLGGVYALLKAGHTVGDHWVQTDHQAACKGGEGTGGRKACAAHVATLAVTQAAFLAVGSLATGERLNPRRVAVGLAINAVTHYAADRREYGILPHLTRLLAPIGKDNFYRAGAPREGRDDKACFGTGAYLLDQSFHEGILPLAAAIIAGPERQ